jgi:hypothetical protein
LAYRRPKFPNNYFAKKYGDGDTPSLPIMKPCAGGGLRQFVGVGEGNQFKIVHEMT